MQDHHQLEIWHRGMTYAVRIYEFGMELPDDERFNLRHQPRKAVTSVPLNIAEGAACATNAEFARFLGYAYRSVKEVMTGLELCGRLFQSLNAAALAALIDEGDQIARMINALRLRLAPERDTWTPPGDQ
jgi:four helix bundle protein